MFSKLLIMDPPQDPTIRSSAEMMLSWASFLTKSPYAYEKITLTFVADPS